MNSTLGLSLSDVVNVNIFLTPTGGQPRNFGAALVIGGSGVIDTTQRIRSYGSITAVGLDFGGTTPEYLAATDFFAQSPQPTQLYIGAWAKAAQPGWLHGAILSPSQQLLSNFTGVTNGSMQLTIGGTLTILSAMNFSTASNLNGVAAIVTTALAGAATCVWNASYQRFDIYTTATGTGGTITVASTTGSGFNISAPMCLTAPTGATTVQGTAAETPLTALMALAAISNDWYMSGFADTSLTDLQHEANAAFIEAASPSRAYGITIQATATLDPNSTSDLAYMLKQSGYTRTLSQYSSSDPYAIFSFFGRFAVIPYSNGQNVAITGKFQNEPGVAYEVLTETQASALNSKNCNVFVEYQNGVAILQQGQCASGLYFDVRQGADWLQNQAQTDLFNAFVQAGSKIPQTDAGMNVLTTTLAGTLGQAVNNGFAAPGQWNAPGFGALTQGQFLTSGYYIYTPSISSQTEAVRITRAAPLMQAAVKLAGAIHSASVNISVNQ